MSSASPGSANGARALVQADLERVIAIDREHSGRSRRGFFEKRFAAAARRPEDFIQIGIARGGALRGFAVGHILRGEFGRTGAAAVLDAEDQAAMRARAAHARAMQAARRGEEVGRGR